MLHREHKLENVICNRGTLKSFCSSESKEMEKCRKFIELDGFVDNVLPPQHLQTVTVHYHS